MDKNNEVNYWNYLKLEKLLDLQEGLEDSDEDVSEDELHFIIVHQVFELWFKLMIKELRMARNKMAAPRVKEETIPYVVHHLKRINTILEMAADHFELMETLTPQDFLRFREKLGTASGFQSFQMREIEFILGLDQEQRDAQNHGDPSKYIIDTAKNSDYGKTIIERINRAKSEKSFREAIHDWLYRTPIHGSSPNDDNDEKIIKDFVKFYIDTLSEMNEKQIQQLVDAGENESDIRERFRKSVETAINYLEAKDVEGDRQRMKRIRIAILFIESYRELPLLAWPRLLIDTIVEMEEKMIEFRFKHARMVERIIGNRVGTGGSSGVDYLDETTKYRIFPELWAVRTLLLPKSKLPNLKNKEKYRFVTDLTDDI